LTPRRPFVSVIVPVKNGERFLAQALADVLAQTYPDREVIVVDGRSTDRSAEIARSFPEVRCITQRGDGFADAWNQGIEAARGDLLAFLDSDDRWMPEKLEKQVAALERDPGLDYAITRARFFLEDGATLPPGFRPSLLSGEHVANMPSALLARRRVFETVGHFPTHLTIANDVEWFARLKDSGLRGVAVQEALVRKRVHDANLSYFAAADFNHELLRLLRESVERQKTGKLVSVIVPVRDGERHVAETLSSVLDQSYVHHELVVVDDGSSDGTRDVLRGFGEAIRWVGQEPSGTAVALNRGVGLARGPFLAFLDADDLWTPRKLELQMAALKADPGLDLVFGQVRQFRDGERGGERPVPGLSKGAMLIRREAFDRVGPFDTSWRVGDFVDWYARATEAGLVSEVLPEVVMLRRIHAGNTTRAKPEALVDYARVARAALERRRAAT